jgi:hypothetical protein
MVNAIGQVLPQHTTLLVAVAIALPIILVGAGLLFLKVTNKLQQNPRAFMIAGILLGLLYVVPLTDGFLRHRSAFALIGYGLCVVWWPVLGIMQYKAKVKSSRE